MDIEEWNAMNIRWITDYIREKTGLDCSKISKEESNRLAIEWIEHNAERVSREFRRGCVSGRE